MENINDTQSYYPFDFYEKFDKLDKCKISGKIENIKKTTNGDYCSFNLEIKIYNNNSFYFLKGTELIVVEPYGSNCLGVYTLFPIYKNGEKDYFPSIGDEIYVIVNKDNDYILEFGKENFNSYSDIPLCETKTDYKNQTMTGGITKQEEIEIKNNIFNKLKALYENNEQSDTNSGTQLINQEKPIIQTKNNIQPKINKNISTSNLISKIEENSGSLDGKVQTGNIVGSGSDISENSFTGIINGNENKTETITGTVNDIKPLENEKNSNYSFVLLGTLFMILILVFILKKIIR